MDQDTHNTLCEIASLILDTHRADREAVDAGVDSRGRAHLARQLEALEHQRADIMAPMHVVGLGLDPETPSMNPCVVRGEQAVANAQLQVANAQLQERTERQAQELRAARDKIDWLERALRRARVGCFDTPTDGDVEQLAQALRAVLNGHRSTFAWEKTPRHWQEEWRRVARHVLGVPATESQATDTPCK